MINDTCATCIYRIDMDKVETEMKLEHVKLGIRCRRYPPTIGYPYIFDTQPACGEYRPKDVLTPVDMITEEDKRRTREGYHIATQREKMVLDLLIMSEDTSSKSIAARLGIAARTVDSYITQVREKKIPSENRHHLVKLLKAAMR